MPAVRGRHNQATTTGATLSTLTRDPCCASGIHHDLLRLLEDIAFGPVNRVLVLIGTGDSFIVSIDGPSRGDITKPMGFDVMYTEGRRGVQRLVDLEIPIIAAVNDPAPVHSEYALLADVVVASDTTVFSDMPHLAFGIASGDGMFVVWEEVLGLNRARHLVITQGSFTAHEALEWGAAAEVVPLGQVLPCAQELAEQMTQRPHLTNRYMAGRFLGVIAELQRLNGQAVLLLK
jgi:enoyl-CoA hydratase/carnithine racemase